MSNVNLTLGQPYSIELDLLGATFIVNPGGGTTRRYNIIPSGLVNGANATFTTPEPFISGSETIYLNGVKQKVADDFIVTSSTTFQFGLSPGSGETLTIDYNI